MTNRSPYLTDYWTDIDQLNFDDFAPALHEILRDAQTPLTVGVFGPWGSGKTSLMRMLRKKIDKPKNPNMRTVWFTAWKYDREDALWRAFILRVLDALYPRESGAGPREDSPRLTDITDATQKEQVAMLERLEESVYRPVNWQELGRWTIDWLTLAQQSKDAGVELAADFLPVPTIVKRVLKLAVGHKDEDSAGVSGAAGREVQQYRLEQLAYMEQFEDRFQKAIKLILGEEGRLVVFVDDLDRCLPEKAVEVLEAIKLFLEVEGTVFVLGMDRGVIGRGVETRYRALFSSQHLERHEMPISGDAYLQKIVQIPFHLPPLAVEDMGEYIAKLDDSIADKKPLDEVTRQVFARGVLPNPRQVKRVLNTFWLLRTIALGRERRGRLPEMGVAWPLLAKTVLIQTQFPELYQEWRIRPTLVQQLEEAYQRRPVTKTEIVSGRVAVPKPMKPEGDDVREPKAPTTDGSGGLLDPYLNDRRKYALLEQMLAYPPPDEDKPGRGRGRFAGLDWDEMAVYVHLAGAVSSDEPAAMPPDKLAEMVSGDAAAMRDAVAWLEEQESDVDGPLHKALRPALVQVMTDVQQPPETRAVAGDGLGLIGDRRPGVGLRDDGLPDIDWVEIPEIDPETGQREFIYQEDEERIESTFWIARYLITNVQYQAFVDDGQGYGNPEWWDGLAADDDHRSAPQEPGFLGLNRPRETVSWYESVAFCRWLTVRVKAKADLLPPLIRERDDWRIALPTEWQWEKAARGYAGREYPWGDGYRSGFANVDETKRKDGSHYLHQTTPVGIYPQGESLHHVLDMSGNVWEWCLDEYDRSDQVQESDDAPCVLRGGSWLNTANLASARDRSRLKLPLVRSHLYGFRVVLFFFRPYSSRLGPLKLGASAL